MTSIYKQQFELDFKGLEFETFERITRLVCFKFFRLNSFVRLFCLDNLFENLLIKFFIKFNFILGCVA